MEVSPQNESHAVQFNTLSVPEVPSHWPKTAFLGDITPFSLAAGAPGRLEIKGFSLSEQNQAVGVQRRPAIEHLKGARPVRLRDLPRRGDTSPRLAPEVWLAMPEG